MRDDDFSLGMMVGTVITVILMLVVMWLVGIESNHRLVNRHPGVNDLLTEMREDCESKPGVVECEWDESELNFVTVDR